MPDKAIEAFPVPTIMDEDRAFWDGVQQDKFLIQKCLSCGHLQQFFPRPACVRCFSRNLGWIEAKGTGTVYSFTPVSMPLSPAIRKQVEETKIAPIFAAVDLDEGVRIKGEIVGSKVEDVKLGARINVVFETAKGTNFKLPKFRLVK